MDKPLADILWVLISGALVFLMQPGFMCLEAGLSRSKNSINVAIKNLADFVISVLGFWVLGFGLMFGASHSGLVGVSHYFLDVSDPWASTFFFFQAMFCGTATTIFSGAVAERMRFMAYVVLAGFVSTLIYPVFGHWAWGGLFDIGTQGWLEARGFVDFAGSTVVHSVGGWVSLAALLVIGPRAGRFGPDGKAGDISSSNLPLTVLGAFLLWFGWFGFNGGSTLELSTDVPGIITKTTLSGAAGGIGLLALGWFLERRPGVSYLINGSIGGLVAITANCHCVSGTSAVIIGLISAPVCLFSERIMLRWRIDDAVSAIPVHLACGIWGTLAVALFGIPEMLGTGLTAWQQLQVQALGIGAAFVVSFVIPYLFMSGLNRIFPLRVSPEEEEEGLNYSEHGAKTELSDLLHAMRTQADLKDLSMRVPVATFSEVGVIAWYYNRVMDALESALARTSAIVATASDAIVTFSKDSLTIFTVNPSTARLFGYEEAALVGAPFHMLLRGQGEGRALDSLLSEENVEVDCCRADGTVFPCEALLSESQHQEGAFYVASIRDISARRQAQREIMESELRYREFFENTGTGIFVDDPDGNISLVNQEFASLTGWSKAEIENRMNYEHFFHPEEIERIRKYHKARLEEPGSAPERYETLLRTREEALIPVLLTVSLIPGTANSLNSFLDLSTLKTTMEALDKQQAYFRQLFESSPLAIALVDVEGRVLEANSGFQAMFGYPVDEIRGQYNRQLLVPDDRKEEVEDLRRVLLEDKPVHRETVRRHRDGRRIPVDLVGYPVSIGGSLKGVYYIYTDMSERKAFEEQLSHQAFHDSLTGLPNRALFLNRLEQGIGRLKRKPEHALAVMLIDLDGFKKINDSLGHQVGDAFLQEVAKRLRYCLREVDTVSRLGGDEFAIIVEEYASNRELIQIGMRVLQSLAEPMPLEGEVLYSSASIGLVLRCNKYETPEDIVRDADTAMYRAKEQGKNRLKIFNRRMHEQALQALRLENDLRDALDNQELELVYQPIFSVADRTLIGFEALSRWRHRILGPISPVTFIPIAEESGLIVPLGAWVIRQACMTLKSWRDYAVCATEVTMNVNLSSRQLEQESLVPHIRQCLEETGVEPRQVKIEITESTIMHDAPRTMDKLHELKEMGLRLVIDDFGTGYSSLSYLQKFPLDTLKIDRSFVSGEDMPEGNEEIIQTIVSLSRTLGLSVVAEGVETEEQLELLRKVRCDEVQGFLLSRPLKNADALALLHRRDEQQGACAV